ncbi:MAG: FecR domain-containing protein [Spirochaetota bacterium]
MRPTLFILALAVLAAGPPLPADEVATVTYVDGYPEVVRDAKPLVGDVDFGFRLESFDAIRTDEASSLAISIDAETGIDADVTVEPETHFYLDLSAMRSEQSAALELVGGTLSVIARRLAGDSSLQVRTIAATMGVRGTTFSVETGPAGELLVWADEGLVEVTNVAGRTLFASPGEAVEIDESQHVFRTLRYHRSRLAEFRREWRTQRTERMLERIPHLVRFSGRRYLAARERFVAAYGELIARRDVIDEWIDEQRRGVRPEPDSLPDAADLARVVARARATMAAFEPLLHRIGRLEPLLGEHVVGVEVRPGTTAADLIRSVNNDRRVMIERVRTVRHVLKLYAQRNDGRAPFESPDRLRDGDAES